MVIQYSYFGSPIGTRNAAGELVVNLSPVNRTFAPVESFPVKFLVKAPTLAAPDLKLAIERATRILLPQGLSVGASLQEIWVVTPSSQPGWFVVEKSVAVGRGLPTLARAPSYELEQLAQKIRPIAGVVAVELDRNDRITGTTPNPITGTTPDPITGTTPNPPTGALPEEGARARPTEPDSGGGILFLALGVGIAAWALTR